MITVVANIAASTCWCADLTVEEINYYNGRDFQSIVYVGDSIEEARRVASLYDYCRFYI